MLRKEDTKHRASKTLINFDLNSKRITKRNKNEFKKGSVNTTSNGSVLHNLPKASNP